MTELLTAVGVLLVSVCLTAWGIGVILTIAGRSGRV